MKKAIAVICAAALIFTLSAAAFAADDEPDLVTGATVFKTGDGSLSYLRILSIIDFEIPVSLLS